MNNLNITEREKELYAEFLWDSNLITQGEYHSFKSSKTFKKNDEGFFDIDMRFVLKNPFLIGNEFLDFEEDLTEFRKVLEADNLVDFRNIIEFHNESRFEEINVLTFFCKYNYIDYLKKDGKIYSEILENATLEEMSEVLGDTTKIFSGWVKNNDVGLSFLKKNSCTSVKRMITKYEKSVTFRVEIGEKDWKELKTLYIKAESCEKIGPKTLVADGVEIEFDDYIIMLINLGG